jgi:hypothetical protein
MPGKKYSFGTDSKMKALEPGTKATLRFLGDPKVVETEYGEKYSIPILLLNHPLYPSLSSKGTKMVWETKAQVISKDLLPLLGLKSDCTEFNEGSETFKKDYLEHTWELRVDDGGAYRLEG